KKDDDKDAKRSEGAYGERRCKRRDVWGTWDWRFGGLGGSGGAVQPVALGLDAGGLWEGATGQRPCGACRLRTWSKGRLGWLLVSNWNLALGALGWAHCPTEPGRRRSRA